MPSDDRKKRQNRWQYESARFFDDNLTFLTQTPSGIFCQRI